MTQKFAPLAPRGAALGDEVHARLADAILDGTLAPGEQLRDQELAEWLGVSRTPVREALQRLERVGLVEVIPHRYTRVALPRAEDDTMEFVAYLMGNLTRMTAARATDETLREALTYADDMVHAARGEDRAALAERSYAFFSFLTRAADNVAVRRVMKEAEVAIRRDIKDWRPFVDCPVARGGLYQEYRDALAARDGAVAEDVLRRIHGLA
ncbi:GntR family transcriptional regulator [Microbacterium hominis]|uniref:GntR family transcriptional regulator n=1 Tax=Microbacterium hominis TaxID=162426 RepID=A0A7D4TP92_9MICO|nr:GntR family transcriptional regulator [Microbacterium hominis]QKJ17984.1 GntR family transcriptional regulator [Microbacterium hominis]